MCVWNKEVEGKQLTVVFRINDKMVSHKNPAVVTDFLKKLSEKC